MALGADNRAVFTTALILSSILLASSQSDSGCITLRNGLPICPRRPDDLTSTGSGSTGIPIGTGDLGQQGTGGSTTTSQPGSSSSLDGWKLLVVRYSAGVQAAFRNAIVAQGAQILEFVGDNAVLVFANRDSVTRAAARHGATMADFRPQVKVSREAATVIAAAAPARRRRDRRRGLLAAAAGMDSDPKDVATAGRGLLSDDSVGPSPILSSLQTWSLHKGVKNEEKVNPRGSRPGSSPTPSPAPEPAPADGGSGSAQLEPELYAISVRLAPGLPSSALNTIVRQWPDALAVALGRSGAGARPDPCRPRLVTDGLYLSTPLLYAFFCDEDMKDGTAWLSNKDFVVFIEPMLNAGPNNAVAGWIAQTGNLSATQYRSPTASLRPYWNANIQGQGVIVGVTDTGLDMSQCYFLDPNYRPGSLMSAFVGNPPRLSLPQHRKVVQYVLPETAGVTWFGSDDKGHGTHVVGTIAGAVLNSTGGLVNDAGTGAAPFARISFFGTMKPQSDKMYVPPPLDDKVLSYHYGAGARISSDSWGRQTALGVAYTSDSRFFDAFSWRNPDFISVISAGNFGANGMMSITAPSTAKNVLTLGSSVNYPRNTPDGMYNTIFYFRFRDARGVLQESVVWPRVGSSQNTWRELLNGKEVTVRLPNPESACAPLTSSLLGSIAILDLADSSCSSATATANVVAASAIAIIYIASDETRFADEQRNTVPQGVSIPFTLLSRVQGVAIRAVVRNISNTAEAMTAFSFTSTSNSSRANFGIDSILPTSGYGPLWDNRIKPDLVAPGGPVVSAYGAPLSFEATRETCSGATTTFQGTSMSAAVTSGHLALMRQYFRDGFYPSGTTNSPVSTPFDPSGMLLKAAVIAGAEPLVGGTALSTGRVLGAAPDGFQGWGRLDISGALPLPGLTHSNFRASVADLGVIQTGDYFHLKGIRATGTGPITASLVWHDYPGGGIGGRDLVNDLDFGFLVNPRNNSLTFNRTRQDSSNNVERVELSSLRAGDNVVFVVFGRSIRHQMLTGPDAQLPQRFSVFVSGHFTGTLKTPLNPLYARPQQLPASQMVFWLNSTACASVITGTLSPSSTCNVAASYFTFTEETDESTGGPVYTIRDQQSRCWALRSNATGATLWVTTCNASIAAGQKFAFFRNPYITNGTTLWQMVPHTMMGSWTSFNGDRRCLRMTGSSIALQASCNEDDVLQNFRLERPPAVPTSPPPPPGPPTPSPSPLASPAQPWYPYPLLFRTDFYPIGGLPNTEDYDYTGADAAEGSISNLDIVVSWTQGGQTYKVTIDNYLIFDNNMTSVAGAVHGGDNQFYGTMYEEVHFQVGYTPPPALYNVCVMWLYAETQQMRVKLTVFRGNAVATVTRVFNTALAINSDNCDPSSPGFVGSYNLTADPAPPAPPPTPPAPLQLPTSYNYPLLFRADWTPISGFTGREKQLVDLDIVVTWMDPASGTSYELGYDFQPMGAKYGGNNMDNRVNYEMVYWPAETIPPAATFNVCVRWYDTKKPLMQVTMSVYRGGLVASSTRMWDTTLDRVFLCDPLQNGFVGNYTVRYSPPPPVASPPRSPPPTPSPPPPTPSSPPPGSGCSTPHSLQVRAQWSDGQAVPAVYDWDLVVAWSFGGRDFALSPDERFLAGGIHGGDNVDLPTRLNEESVYWPTVITGQAPPSTTYHVCVRWYQAGSLAVTMTATFGDGTVRTASRTWASNTFFSKRCSPDSNGFIGSFNYTSAANTTGSGPQNLGGSEGWSSSSNSFVAKAGDAGNGVQGAEVDDLQSGGSLAQGPTGTTTGGPAPAPLSGGSDNALLITERTPLSQQGSSAGGSGGDGSGSSGSSSKHLWAVAIGSGLGGAALVGAAVGVVQLRKVKVRNSRVMAM